MHSNLLYISLSGHLIDLSFQMKYVVLNVKHFPGSHTGIAISDILQKVRDCCNISNKKYHLLIRDNAVNIRLGAELSNIDSQVFLYTHSNWP